MGDDKENNVWPMPKFYFRVDFSELGQTSFQEVSGLDTETQTIEYRHGNSTVHSPVKMPSIAKFGNVTLKRGIIQSKGTFWTWSSKIKMNTIKRETVTISLLDEAGNPTMVWKLANAWPTKITGTDLKSEGTEIAIDTVELAYETLTVSNS